MLRGINLGSRNRVAMPALRQALSAAGLKDVRTYLQSGNVAISSPASPDRLETQVRELITEHFGLEIAVLVRTGEELAEIVRLNPLGDVATDSKRYQVSFLSAELSPERVQALSEVATGEEALVAVGREVYAWHPAGVARSKLWAKLAGPGLGVTATARNWATVTALAEMAAPG